MIKLQDKDWSPPTGYENRPEYIYTSLKSTREVLTYPNNLHRKSLSYTCKQVIVDNYTPNYLYIEDAERYAIPNTIGQSFHINTGTVNILWQAPQGITQPAVSSGIAIVTFNEREVLATLVSLVSATNQQIGSLLIPQGAASLTANSDNLYTFPTQVHHLLIENNTTTPLNVEFDAQATAGSLLIPAGSAPIGIDVAVTVVHLYSAAASPVNGTAGSNIVLRGAV